VDVRTPGVAPGVPHAGVQAGELVVPLTDVRNARVGRWVGLEAPPRVRLAEHPVGHDHGGGRFGRQHDTTERQHEAGGDGANLPSQLHEGLLPFSVFRYGTAQLEYYTSTDKATDIHKNNLVK